MALHYRFHLVEVPIEKDNFADRSVAIIQYKIHPNQPLNTQNGRIGTVWEDIVTHAIVLADPCGDQAANPVSSVFAFLTRS